MNASANLRPLPSRRRWLLGAMGVAAVALAAWPPFPAAAQPPNTDGEVTKIDRAQNRIELRHAEIRNLDMPAMKMVFRVSDPKLLDGLAVGDRVRFAAEKVQGQFTVVSIGKAN
jgi:Cu/Ag efflux protein CusF